MTLCMLLEAPQATTGALDPYGPPSIIHKHTQVIYSLLPCLYPLALLCPRRGVECRWIRCSGDTSLQMVRKQDGEYIANIAEMDDMIRTAWRPVNGRYEASLDPLVQHFMQEYRQHIRHSDMTARVLTGAVLLKRAARMGVKTANGLDQWSISMLNRL